MLSLNYKARTFLWHLLPSLVILLGGEQTVKERSGVCMLWENEGDKILEIVKGAKVMHSALAIARVRL